MTVIKQANALVSRPRRYGLTELRRRLSAGRLERLVRRLEPPAMTQDEMREALKIHIAERYKRQRNAARHWGVSDAYISSVLLGKKRPSQRILDEIGLREKVTIEYVSLSS